MSDIKGLLLDAAEALRDYERDSLAAKLEAAAESLGEPVVTIGADNDLVWASPYTFLAAGTKLFLAPQPAVPEWQPIETAPHNKPVLIHYKNGCGKGRTIKAEFIPADTIEASGEYDDHCEYNEALDNYFWPEGWHEMIDNWGEYSHVVVNETPTHWMPLPEPPAGDSHE